MTWKSGEVEDVEAAGWTCDGFWLHLYDPELDTPVFKTIHHDEVTAIEYVNISRQDLRKLEDE